MAEVASLGCERTDDMSELWALLPAAEDADSSVVTDEQRQQQLGRCEALLHSGDRGGDLVAMRKELAAMKLWKLMATADSAGLREADCEGKTKVRHTHFCR